MDTVKDILETSNIIWQIPIDGKAHIKSAEANQREDALQKINNLIDKFENQYHVQEKSVQETNNGNPLGN
ncbi:unnamed protein product [Adineta steineri]|uniref:Uncharacterized protein n=2 Tax=Adineta steineri TaxID=433720 RepID=A0A815B760_9BILA|nr:unnamed protein product [Adineta steineri]